MQKKQRNKHAYHNKVTSQNTMSYVQIVTTGIPLISAYHKGSKQYFFAEVYSSVILGQDLPSGETLGSGRRQTLDLNKN